MRDNPRDVGTGTANVFPGPGFVRDKQFALRRYETVITGHQSR